MEDVKPRSRMPAVQRRATILRAATEVFSQAGYRAAKMSDIAARVGVTEPVVFQNFGSKAALFAAVLENAVDQARAMLSDSAGGYESAAELLRAHVLGSSAADGGHAVGGQATRRPPAAGGEAAHAGGHGGGVAFGALFADATALAADPGVADSAARALRALATHLADIIRRGRRDGSIRTDLDPDTAAWLLLSVLSAAPLRRVGMPPRLEPAVGDLLTRLLTS